MRTRWLSMLAAAVLSSTAAAQQPAPQPVAPAPPPPANQADVSSLDAIMKAVYDVISGPAGEERNWDRMRSLFIPGARLGPIVRGRDGTFVARMGSLEDYIRASGPMLTQNGFFEREIARTVETYGHLTHLFSTYESRHLPSDAKPFQRGINSFQLLYDGTRWWVVSIYWEGERPDGSNPIPEKYLPK